MDNSVIIAAVSVLLVLTVTGMGAFLVAGAKGKSRARALSVIRGGAAVQGRAARKDIKDLRREQLSRKLKESSDSEKHEKKQTVALSLMQAGLTITAKQFWIFSVLFAAAVTFLMFAMGKSPFVILMSAIIAFFGVPKFVLKRMIMRRQKKFLAELADALEAMTRLLRAGMPVSEAIKMVAREFTGPVGEEMGRIFDQQKIGVSLPEAVTDCARRMPLAEVQMFATAVTIQAQTGSSLSEILDNLAKVIRARFKLKRKVQALSSEAKSSAMIIGCLPLFVASAMYLINPDYIGTLFVEPTGKLLLCGAAFWMSCGIFCMKQMINFKI